jgi:hypothetical protein
MTGRAGVWETDDIVQFYIALLDFFPATVDSHCLEFGWLEFPVESVNKRADWNVPVSLQCIVVSALKKTAKVNRILKVIIFKHSVILFRCSMIW